MDRVKNEPINEMHEIVAVCFILWIGNQKDPKIPLQVPSNFNAESIAREAVMLVSKSPQNIPLDLMVPIFTNMVLVDTCQREDDYLYWLTKLSQIATKSSLNCAISSFLRIAWHFSVKKNLSHKLLEVLTYFCCRIEKRLRPFSTFDTNYIATMSFYGGKALLLFLKNQVSEASILAEDVIKFLNCLRQQSQSLPNIFAFGFSCAILVFVEIPLVSLADEALHILGSFDFTSLDTSNNNILPNLNQGTRLIQEEDLLWKSLFNTDQHTETMIWGSMEM